MEVESLVPRDAHRSSRRRRCRAVLDSLRLRRPARPAGHFPAAGDSGRPLRATRGPQQRGTAPGSAVLPAGPGDGAVHSARSPIASSSGVCSGIFASHCPERIARKGFAGIIAAFLGCWRGDAVRTRVHVGSYGRRAGCGQWRFYGVRLSDALFGFVL